MEFQDKINLEDIVTWRNHIHQNPELSFQEIKTSQYIYDVLQSFGQLEITRPTKTSVVAVLDTKRPGKCIALRADIDALPMEEYSNVAYSSQNKGVMHSCGHDTHTAMLLGAAQVLTQIKDELVGKVKFIFQHAEEVLPGGAIELVAKGVIDDVDEIYG
ncbi:MAG: M20 metallopeptidase family protein, partial [Bacilli bacterium]